MKQSCCVASLVTLAALVALTPPAHALDDPAPAPETEAAPPRDVAGMSCREIRAESNGLQRQMMAESRTQQQQMMARMQGGRGRGAGGGMAAASILGSVGSMIPGVGMFVGQAASMAAREAARAEQRRMMSGVDDANAMALRMMELSQRVQDLEMSFSERCDPRMASLPAPAGGEEAGGTP